MGDTNRQIEKCLIFIKDHVTGVDLVADKLIEKGVLKMSERESMLGNKSTTREQIQSILDIVTKRKKGDVFIAVLNETHNEHVAKKITSMEITTGQKDVDRSKTFTKDHTETEELEAKLLKELANAQLENKHLKHIHGKLREDLNERTLRLQELNRTSHENKLKYTQLENKNKKLEAENQELTEKEQEITQLLKEIEHLKTELDDKKKKINRLDERLNGVENQLLLNKGIHKEVTDKLLVDNAQLKADNKKMQSENADIKSMCEKTLEHVSQLAAKINPRPNPRPIPPWRTGTKVKPSPTPRNK